MCTSLGIHAPQLVKYIFMKGVHLDLSTLLQASTTVSKTEEHKFFYQRWSIVIILNKITSIEKLCWWWSAFILLATLIKTLICLNQSILSKRGITQSQQPRLAWLWQTNKGLESFRSYHKLVSPGFLTLASPPNKLY